MAFQRLAIRLTLAASCALGLSAATGCETDAQTGTLAGAGIGALAGQAIGGSTGATVIGAAAGAGIGYVIGNEKDKKKAREMSEESRSAGYSHTDVGPLAGTRWSVRSIEPRDVVEPFTSCVVEFDNTGHVRSTTTRPDGSIKTERERYRVVGDTFIANANDYLINAKFAIDGDQLILSASDFSAVLERLP
jgi:hypothetical protein